jgi:hypothetical protein
MNQILKNTSSVGRALRAFHEDEGGMQVVEAVVILAVSAVLLIGVVWLWKSATINNQSEGIRGLIASVIGQVFTQILKDFGLGAMGGLFG